MIREERRFCCKTADLALLALRDVGGATRTAYLPSSTIRSSKSGMSVGLKK